MKQHPVQLRCPKCANSCPAGSTRCDTGREYFENLDVISQMTLEEKVSICCGADCWTSKSFPNLGIPSFRMSDGPHGLRCQSGKTDIIGINVSEPSTCFPTAVTAGASWDTELFSAEGRAIGEEAVSLGVDVVLGPGCNIKRNPLCGRNFEYISEDPCVAGEMAAAFIGGQQSTGVASSLKHFAANSQEYKRMNGDSLVDDRALREIYLAPFETAVRKSRPGTVMCSYNKINGTHSSDNAWLLTEVLRNEWGFNGLVVTDWGAMNDRVAGFRAGCDFNMPGGSDYMEKAVLRAVHSGELSEAFVDASVRRVLSLARKSAALKKGGDFDVESHHALARRIAEEGAVLLKNEGGILPLHEEEAVIIGYMAKNFRYQGSGSSHINPTRLLSLTDALPEVPFVPCGDALGAVTDAELARASEAAAGAKTAVVVAGLPDNYECEGFDRPSLAMPEGHVRMINAVADANPNTVVVLLGGSPMELPWIDKVKAVLFMGLPGQAGAEACAALLTGEACPSGKLTETWPLEYSDVPSVETFGEKNPEYRESIYVGYRFYDKAGTKVRFPFGFGLSYTTFSYSDLHISGRKLSFSVKNTGSIPGAEVVQIYVAPPAVGLHRPVKELRRFARIELAPGDSREVKFELDDRCFALWAGSWQIPSGEYEILVASSSADVRLHGTMEIAGTQVPAPDWQAGSWYENCRGLPSREVWEKLMGHPVQPEADPPKGGFTMDSSCLEMKPSSLTMKLFYRIAEKRVAKTYAGGKDLSDPSFKMMVTCATDCPLRTSIINTGGEINDAQAACLLELANGHPLRAVRRLITG